MKRSTRSAEKAAWTEDEKEEGGQPDVVGSKTDDREILVVGVATLAASEAPVRLWCRCGWLLVRARFSGDAMARLALPLRECVCIA